MTFGRSGKLPTNAEVALWFISKREGLTEAALAELMFGERNQPRVHQDVDLLESRGLIRRDRTTSPLTLYSNITR
jgi:predicted transcriptional regulator